MPTKQNHSREEHWTQSTHGLWLPPSYQKPQSPSSPSSRRSKTPWTDWRVAGKSLWEWMSLLLIPLLVGLGTIWVTNQQTIQQNALAQQLHIRDEQTHKSDQEIAQQ